jgi:predicted  nucleic acid-binding Zn-ribbon protein
MAELTIAEKLKQLYELQIVDSQIDKIEVLKGELPIEVSDLEDEITGLETRISRLDGQKQDLEDQVSKHEANIKEAQALIEKYGQQMDNVKNNREFEALTKELELQKLEIQLSEKKIRQTKVEVDNKTETLNATVERKEKKEADLKTKKVELEDIIAKTMTDEEKLIRKSDRLKKKIEDWLLKSYEKIRHTYRNGLAVVQIERNSCGGCFNKIPPQLQLELAQRTKIIACEHCGRILVDDYILDVGKKPKETEKVKE